MAGKKASPLIGAGGIVDKINVKLSIIVSEKIPDISD